MRRAEDLFKNRQRALVVRAGLRGIALVQIDIAQIAQDAPFALLVLQHGKLLLRGGETPHSFSLRPSDARMLHGADVVFWIGPDLERPLQNILASLADVRSISMLDTPRLETLTMRSAHAHAHDETDHGHHHDAAVDPHIWLSPPLVRLQAGTILKALTAADPGRSKDYETNYRRFVNEIDALDRDLKTLFSGKEGLPFMVFHPAWGYFAQAYGLTQVPIEIEGKDPKPAQLQDMIENARAQGIRVVFVQPQFSVKRAELVAREIGGQVAFADPLAPDWLTNLRAVAGKFKAALQ